ncbi:unnamed protein product [Tuber aestivum]|uniref:BRCT domain-containing protein n=1 Tax=Tuber aestivum TaxID=59557 RepID=A0A292Q4X8_9PEZI|nr:unnamed protein product [Tuber aestivum]
MSSSLRIRLNFADPESPSSWVSLVSNGGGKRRSFFVYRDGNQSLQIDTVDDESSGYDRPVVLAAIRIVPSPIGASRLVRLIYPSEILDIEDSDVFVEAIYSPNGASYITRDPTSPVKRRIPLSHPPKEHMLVLLDYSCFLCIDGEKIQLDLGDSSMSTARPALKSSADRIDNEGDISMGIDDDPHIQVVQSMQDPMATTVHHGIGYRDSTPVIPETNPEETIVVETPVKSRFFSPMSSGRTPKAQESYASMGNDLLPPGNRSAGEKLMTTLPESGLVFAGYDGKAGEGVTSQSPVFADRELSTSEEENEAPRYLVPRPKGKQPELTSLELDTLVARPGKGISREQGVAAMGSAFSNLTSLGEPDGEKENRHQSPSSLESTTASDAGKPLADDDAEIAGRASEKEHRIHTAKTTESLPEAFLYEEHMKSATPGRTYSKKKPAKSPLSAKKSLEKSPEDRGHADRPDGSTGGSVSTPLRQKKRKALESPSEAAAGKDEGRKKDTSGKGGNKRRKAGSELRDTPMKGAVGNEAIITPARRGLRGRKIVYSQPEDSGAEVQGAIPESPLQKEEDRVQQQPQEPQAEEPPVEEKEAELTSTAKVPKRKGRKKLSDEEVSVGVPPDELPIVVGHRESQERAGTPGMGQSSREITEEPEAVMPMPKRAGKPATRKGVRTRKSLAASPPTEIPQKQDGDTQYTVPSDTQTQTQTLDRVEIKTPKSIAKSAAKSKKTPLRRRGASSRNTSEEVSLNGEQDLSQGEGIIVRTRERYEGDAPRIVFSNSGLDGKKVLDPVPTVIRKDIEKFLRAAAAKKIDNVSAPGVNFLVVGPGELKRTPKLTIGVALGKTVVEDQWLMDSKEIGYFLDPDPYIPNDPLHEKEWGFNLAAAVKRGRQGGNSVLKGWNVNITLALVSQLKAGKQEESLVEMLKAAGAGNIAKKAPRGAKKGEEQTLVLGSEKGDSEVSALEKSGWAVFSAGIVALSVLRGKLNTDTDEFLIKSDVGSGTTGQAQRPRRRAK